jgi:hypothetical protein
MRTELCGVVVVVVVHEGLGSGEGLHDFPDVVEGEDFCGVDVEQVDRVAFDDVELAFGAPEFAEDGEGWVAGARVGWVEAAGVHELPGHAGIAGVRRVSASDSGADIRRLLTVPGDQ